VKGRKGRINWGDETFSDTDEVVAERHQCSVNSVREARNRRGIYRGAGKRGRPITTKVKFCDTGTPLPDTTGMSRAHSQLAWAEAAKAGCAEAADLLLHSVDRFVRSEVVRFLGRCRSKYTHDDVEDLCAEVRATLFERIGQFDPSKAGWVTYAEWWIRPTCTRWLRINDRIVHEPSKYITRRGKAHEATERLSATLGREPTDEEVAIEVGITPRTLRLVRESKSAKVVPIDEISRVLAGDDSSVLDILERRGGNAEVQALLNKLNGRERTIIELRYGIGHERERTLEEVGAVFGFTRERARQVEAAAMQKLRKLAMGGLR
jgi:RNA polymerase primary sigma factor